MLCLDIFEEFKSIAENPKKQFADLLSEGKKVIGCLPYYCPEELIYAAGMIPFGIWGADIEATESKRWFPSFICSILHTALELGIKGEFDGMTAVMVPKLCDSLKCMGANWECAVPGIPVINVTHAQNRKMAAGVEFTASQYRKALGELERLSGKPVSNRDISDAISLLNKRRRLLRSFTSLAASHADVVSPRMRNDVIKSSYYLEAERFISMLEELNDLLSSLPVSMWSGLRIVTTGILADSPMLLDILEESHIAIVDDQVVHESVSFCSDVPEDDGSGDAADGDAAGGGNANGGDAAGGGNANGGAAACGDAADPVVRLARMIANIEGTSVLHDPGKRRASELVRKVSEANADGVIFILTKFCDPEEYDYVPVKKLLDTEGIPCLLIEVDRQTAGYEQARSAIEAFAGMINLNWQFR